MESKTFEGTVWFGEFCEKSDRRLVLLKGREVVSTVDLAAELVAYEGQSVRIVVEPAGRPVGGTTFLLEGIVTSEPSGPWEINERAVLVSPGHVPGNWRANVSNVLLQRCQGKRVRVTVEVLEEGPA